MAYDPPANATIPVPLSSPIRVFGDEVHTLMLRPMTMGDIKRIGLEFSSDMKLNAGLVTRAVHILGNIPEADADQISAADFMALSSVIFGFFDNGES